MDKFLVILVAMLVKNIYTLENIARGKEAFQSSTTFHINHKLANFATDSNIVIDDGVSGYECAKTHSTVDEFSWFAVDLENIYKVERVCLLNGMNSNYLNNFEITVGNVTEVGNNFCARVIPPIEKSTSTSFSEYECLTCADNAVGSFVLLKKTVVNSAIMLCDIIVEGKFIRDRDLHLKNVYITVKSIPDTYYDPNNLMCKKNVTSPNHRPYTAIVMWCDDIYSGNYLLISQRPDSDSIKLALALTEIYIYAKKFDKSEQYDNIQDMTHQCQTKSPSPGVSLTLVNHNELIGKMCLAELIGENITQSDIIILSRNELNANVMGLFQPLKLSNEDGDIDYGKSVFLTCQNCGYYIDFYHFGEIMNCFQQVHLYSLE
ncbi:DgyrCDS14642 [Dimorphilus gyrociliatus]|uniref:DgyrCDS14642 n=1 Tax=Dimorphilus gyrociliatus TaxID=2664684 RepID=A0A7I8WEE0_9ANNE|nr:DgyrCDS14642 [Dimorphilus gyrociliatus]